MTVTKPKIVAAGIDTLNIGFNILEYRVDDSAFKQLEFSKQSACGTLFSNKGVTVSWGGSEFNLLAKGTRGYEYIFMNDDIRLYLARVCQGGKVYPEVFVQFKSSYLWRKSYNDAYTELRKWLSNWAVINGEKINRVDMCADLETALPRFDVSKEVVTKARKKADYTQIEHYTNGRHDTGYRIGSGDLLARVYDKAYEIKRTEKMWFQDIWRTGGWDGVTGITRVEYQARRPLLKDFGVNTYENLIERLPDMWRYFTDDWMVIKEPNNNDTNHRRWKISCLWQSVQEAGTHFGECLGILPWKTKQPRIEPLMAQMKGLMVAEVAIDSQVRGEYHATMRLKSEINRFLDSEDFKFQVSAKRGKYSSISG